MGSKITNLRAQFKSHMVGWERELSQYDLSEAEKASPKMLQDVEDWGHHVEITLEQEIKSYENFFRTQPLQGEYLRSVNESFEDLNLMLSKNKTLSDLISEKNNHALFTKIKFYYNQHFVPLLNILAKLENDYHALITDSALKQKHNLHHILDEIQLLKEKKRQLKNQHFSFHRKDEILDLAKKLKNLESEKNRIQKNLYRNR